MKTITLLGTQNCEYHFDVTIDEIEHSLAITINNHNGRIEFTEETMANREQASPVSDDYEELMLERAQFEIFFMKSLYKHNLIAELRKYDIEENDFIEKILYEGE